MSSLHNRIEARLRERIEAAEKAAPCGCGQLDLGPLFARLDDVLSVVESTQDYSVEPYRDQVRAIVCETCRQDASGQCATRDSNVCGLDRHFDLIVAAIEQELQHDPGLPQAK